MTQLKVTPGATWLGTSEHFRLFDNQLARDNPYVGLCSRQHYERHITARPTMPPMIWFHKDFLSWLALPDLPGGLILSPEYWQEHDEWPPVGFLKWNYIVTGLEEADERPFAETVHCWQGKREYIYKLVPSPDGGPEDHCLGVWGD